MSIASIVLGHALSTTRRIKLHGQGIVPTNRDKGNLCLNGPHGLLVIDQLSEKAYWFDGPDAVPPIFWAMYPFDEERSSFVNREVQGYYVAGNLKEEVCDMLPRIHGLSVEVFHA